MAIIATFHRGASALLLCALWANGLSASVPVKEVHRCSIHCPKYSGPTEKYIVQKGDLLSCIATWSGTTVGQLAGVNHLSNPDVILPGSTLVVPAGKKSTSVIVPCVLNKHNHLSSAGIPRGQVRKRNILGPQKTESKETVAVDWASLLRLRISVEIEGNNAPHIQVTPIMFVPMTEDMKKDNGTVTGEWKTIRIGNEEYRVRVTVPEISPTAPAPSKEVPSVDKPKQKAIEVKLSTGPDAQTFVAIEKK